MGGSLGGPKTSHSPLGLSAKVKIRENVLEAIGAEKASIFDAFAGDGLLWRRVWHRAGRYVGCDLRWVRDDRRVCHSETAWRQDRAAVGNQR